ncbi:hypothetical protein [Neolewinella aurantiaca]|nr:hypothetical protein [Neolewinella aurantiaca]
MDAILNLLTPDQIEFIITAYGSVVDFLTIQQTTSIAIEDMIL